MHALMTPVLLRVSGVDSLQLNPEPDPPHAEPRKPRQARRGERRTVIGKDPRGQAVLPESRFHQRPHVRRVAARDPLTTQQIAARRIGNRQRIAAFAVAGVEPTLEIDRPNLVGRLGAGELTGRRGVAPAHTGVGESVAFQQRPDSGVRRPIDVRVGALESRFELVFAPSGTARPQGQDLSLDLGGKGLRLPFGRFGLIGQSGDALLGIAIEPFVAGLTADAEAPTDGGHGILPG